MNIVTDIRNENVGTHRGYLLLQLIGQWASRCLDNRYIMLADEGDVFTGLPSNVSVVHFPVLSGLKKLFSGFSKKLNALSPDIFIGSQYQKGIAATARQYLFINEPAQITEKQKKDMQAVQGIIVASNDLRKRITKFLPESKNKIRIAAMVSPLFLPMTVEESTAVKEICTDGQEFFLCSDFDLDADSLTYLLKSFSKFKKMQQTTWKLMVALRHESQHGLEKLLERYRYRQDVVLLPDADIDTVSRVCAAAYAVCSVSVKNRFPVIVWEALQANTPIIAVKGAHLPPETDQLLIKMPEDDQAALADAIMFLYKNEQLRGKYKQKIVAFMKSKRQEAPWYKGL
ncbi:MAG: glycosyltransferase [Niabella sp.]